LEFRTDNASWLIQAAVELHGIDGNAKHVLGLGLLRSYHIPGSIARRTTMTTQVVNRKKAVN
jgi:hypothetical protein